MLKMSNKFDILRKERTYGRCGAGSFWDFSADTDCPGYFNDRFPAQNRGRKKAAYRLEGEHIYASRGGRRTGDRYRGVRCQNGSHADQSIH